VDPDPGGPKTCGSSKSGSGSATLVKTGSEEGTALARKLDPNLCIYNNNKTKMYPSKSDLLYTQ
jgi:hypothetical protein